MQVLVLRCSPQSQVVLHADHRVQVVQPPSTGGQVLRKHSLVSRLGPEHVSPPYWGGGWEHVRLLDLVPVPHDSEQYPHLLHPLQPPSTRHSASSQGSTSSLFVGHLLPQLAASSITVLVLDLCPVPHEAEQEDQSPQRDISQSTGQRLVWQSLASSSPSPHTRLPVCDLVLVI